MNTTTTAAPATTAPPAPIIPSETAEGDDFLDSIFKRPSPSAAPVPETKADLLPAAPETKTEPATKPATPSKPAKTGPPKTGLAAMLEPVEDEPAEGEEAKPAESASEEDDTPADATPAAKYKWGELKKEAKLAKVLQAELENTKKALEDAKKVQVADPVRKENEELKAKYEEAQKYIEIADVTKSDRYLTEIMEPWDKLCTKAERIALSSGLEKDAFVKAFQEPDPVKRDTALTELLESVSELRKHQIPALADAAADLIAKDVAMRENSYVASKELRAREAEKAEKSKTESKAAQMRAVADIAAKMKPLAKYFTAEDENPETVMQAIADAAQAAPFQELTTEEQAFAVVSGNALHRAKAVIDSLRKELESAKRESKAMAGAAPTPGQGTRSTEPAKKTGMSFEEAIGFA